MAQSSLSFDAIRAINTAVFLKSKRAPHTRNTAPARRVAELNAAERRTRILAMINADVSVEDISDRLGVSIRTVRRAQATRQSPSRHASADEKCRAELMLRDGASYQEVARTLGRHGSTISTWFPGYVWTAERRSEAAAMARKMAQL